MDFHIANIPYSMEYDLLIRYESQVSPTRWVKHAEVRWCVFWSSSLPRSHSLFLDASRLGGGADLGDPARLHPHQQPLWKHHPR